MRVISEYEPLTHRTSRALLISMPARKKLAQLLLIGVGLLSLALPSQATIIVTDPTAPPAVDPQCKTSEVKLGGSKSDACAGYYDPFNGNPAGETNLLNMVTDGDDWTFVYKLEREGPVLGDVFNGIEISLLSTDIGKTKGTYTIGWKDTNGVLDLNLPVTLDIATSIKASTKIGYFMFEQELLTNDPFERSGSFDLLVKHGLSHQSLFVRLATDDPDPDPNPNPVPVPGTLALLGFGLLSLRMSRRRRW